MDQEKPTLTNEEILILINSCNELCATIETHDLCYQIQKQNYPWQFLMARKNDMKNLLIKYGL